MNCSQGNTEDKYPVEDVSLLRHRILGIWTIFFALTAVLLGRLVVLMMHPDATPVRWQEQLRVRATMEHLDGHLTDDGRGRILYRNGQPMSGNIELRKLVTRDGPIPYTVHSERTSRSSYDAHSEALAVVGEVGLPDTWPAENRVVAEQGRSGLEASFDALLSGQRPGYIGVLRRADGRPAEPADSAGSSVFRTTPKAGPDLRTTLDPAWQNAAEQAIGASGIRLGSIAIIDVQTNQLIAAANRSPNGPFDLPLVKSAVPGSVMKLVTAAAAFDSYRFGPNTVFYCNGVSQLEGVRMHCWTIHGRETLNDAIARSCDIALAIVGTRVSRQGLQTTWDRLHLSTPNLQSEHGRPVLREAQSGVLFRRAGSDNGLLANTAIGQEDVRFSPLAAANLASTIANKGVYRDVSLVLDAEKQHHVQRRFPGSPSWRALSPFTAEKLTTAMSQAVLEPEGTGHVLAAYDVPVAVKTGTAELPDGNVNGWIIGFAPVRNPQIAFSVYAGDLPSSTAHQAVSQMAGMLLETYRQFPSSPLIG